MTLQMYTENNALFWELDSPENRNALSFSVGKQMLKGLAQVEKSYAEWQRRPSRQLQHRALVITARPSGGIWIAGGDLREHKHSTRKDQGREFAKIFSTVCIRLERLPLPVVSLIDGAAIGGGAELVLPADLRFATQDASLDFRHLKVGLVTGFGGGARLIRLIGKSAATDLLLRCRQLSAPEARRCGLVHEVRANSASLLELLHTTVAGFAHLDPQVLAVQKQMLYLDSAPSAQALLPGQLRLFSKVWLSRGHKAFLQKFFPT